MPDLESVVTTVARANEHMPPAAFDDLLRSAQSRTRRRRLATAALTLAVGVIAVVVPSVATDLLRDDDRRGVAAGEPSVPDGFTAIGHDLAIELPDGWRSEGVTCNPKDQVYGVEYDGVYFTHVSDDPCLAANGVRPNGLAVIDRSGPRADVMVKESQQGRILTVGEWEVSMSSYCKASLPGICVLTASSDDFDAVLRFEWMGPGTWTAQDAVAILSTLTPLK